MNKLKYYSLKNIMKKQAYYNVIFGERSNGKSYAVLKYILENFVKYGKQGAIVRRFYEDFSGKRGQQMWNALIASGEVEKMTDGEWTSIYYWSSRWYLCRYEDGKRVTHEAPIAFGFAVSGMESDKSTSYPNITTILFDEFISRSGYLSDEFILFTNVCSTIIRQRNDVIIFMLGNTVNRYCPYFKEMGLKHVEQMKPGTIDLYTYGSSDLTVAVEYCSPLNKEGKPSDVYFAFDNPKLNMITGGSWEIDIYPHKPCKFTAKDIIQTVFLEWEQSLLQLEMVYINQALFLFIHRKTTPIKDEDNDYIFSTRYDPRMNWHRNILKGEDKLGVIISNMFKKEKVFYQDNEVGEEVRNYLLFCKGLN